MCVCVLVFLLQLKTRHGCEYLVQYDTESIIWDWFKVIQESIRQLRTIPEAADHKPQKKVCSRPHLLISAGFG